MNIENHIHNAQKTLDGVREKVTIQEYESALAMVSVVMSETRELIDHVYKLHAMKTEVEQPSGG